MVGIQSEDRSGGGEGEGSDEDKGEGEGCESMPGLLASCVRGHGWIDGEDDTGFTVVSGAPVGGCGS